MIDIILSLLVKIECLMLRSIKNQNLNILIQKFFPNIILKKCKVPLKGEQIQNIEYDFKNQKIFNWRCELGY